ncbi:MAG TPA: hypothetical protein VNM16_11100 [Bacillota bacterium]|nr:hypothetical protein [Bacillota bacterium]
MRHPDRSVWRSPAPAPRPSRFAALPPFLPLRGDDELLASLLLGSAFANHPSASAAGGCARSIRCKPSAWVIDDGHKPLAYWVGGGSGEARAEVKRERPYPSWVGALFAAER